MAKQLEVSVLHSLQSDLQSVSAHDCARLTMSPGLCQSSVLPRPSAGPASLPGMLLGLLSILTSSLTTRHIHCALTACSFLVAHTLEHTREERASQTKMAAGLGGLRLQERVST